MNSLKIFENSNFGQVRAMEVYGQPYFVGKDVAEILGYERATKAIQDHVDEEDKDVVPIQDSIGRKQNTPVINESGLYSLILSSKMPNAKQFKHWVTSDVLPTIRKHGMYAKDEILNNPDLIISIAQELKDERSLRSRLQDKVEQDKPKVLFADSVATSKQSILVGELAKIIKQNGINIGQKRFFDWLRNNGYLIKRYGTDHNMPTQYSMEHGLFEIKETAIEHADGHTSISKTPKVTGKGQQYFINKLLLRKEMIKCETNKCQANL